MIFQTPTTSNCKVKCASYKHSPISPLVVEIMAEYNIKTHYKYDTSIINTNKFLEVLNDMV